jgi:hypothetical protein
MRFDSQVEELDAASAATEGSKRSVRTRIVTGFAREEDVPKPEKVGLQFQSSVEEFEAASEDVLCDDGASGLEDLEQHLDDLEAANEDVLGDEDDDGASATSI